MFTCPTLQTKKAGLAVVLLCCGSSVLQAASDNAPAELRLKGDWTVAVTVPGNPPLVGEVTIARPQEVLVVDEKYNRLPDFNPKAPRWRKGVRLQGVIAAECSVEGLVDPESLIVKASPGSATPAFKMGTDYDADVISGCVSRLPAGKIAANQPVFISYRYTKQRLDSIVLSAEGEIVIKQGTPDASMPTPPPLSAGERRLANIHIPGPLPALTKDNLFPILETAYPESQVKGPRPAELYLPNTMKKLRTGEPIKVLAWGDSVSTFNRYQSMFVERLRKRFPNAKIELVTEAWGGRNSGTYLAEPPGSEHNYKEKVLAVKPDLIVSEFVNDAYLKEPQVEERYSQLLADFQKIGAEWIILSPHYVRPGWMGLNSQREIDEDPRPYVKGLRLFAHKHHVALADASLRYGRLWRQGIPYLTLMENNINHPNVQGHEIFADALMALFPER